MFSLQKLANFAKLITTPVIGAFVVGYFAFHSLKGDHGLNAYLRLSAELAEAEKVLVNRHQKRSQIERRTALLRPNNLDLDTLDERARVVLNFMDVNERIIFE